MAAPFIATEPIYFYGDLAHRTGDVVPEENVKANGWEKHVSREGTKTAEKAVAERSPLEP